MADLLHHKYRISKVVAQVILHKQHSASGSQIHTGLHVDSLLHME